MRAARMTAVWLLVVATGVPLAGGGPERRPTPATLPAIRPATRPATAPASRPATRPATQPAAVPETSADRAGDELSAKVDGRSAVVDIRSSRGIGSGRIVLAARRAPHTLRLRLHLRGLENLRISDGTVTVTLSVLSHSGHPVLARLRRPGQDRSIDLKPDDPRRPAVRLVGPDGKQTRKFPLPKGGCIEVTLPPPLLKQLGRSLRLRWIDFYR